MLSVTGSLVSSFQMVFEEKLLTGYDVSVKKTVGAEGFWGIIFMSFTLLMMDSIPGSDHGVYESLPDTIHMASNSTLIFWLLLSSIPLLTLWNWVGIQICQMPKYLEKTNFD